MSLLMQALRTAEAKKKQGSSTPAGIVPPATPAALDAAAASPASEAGELTLEVKEPTREDIAAAKEVAEEAAARALQETDAPADAPAIVEPVDYFSSETPPARTPFVVPAVDAVDDRAADPALAGHPAAAAPAIAMDAPVHQHSAPDSAAAYGAAGTPGRETPGGEAGRDTPGAGSPATLPLSASAAAPGAPSMPPVAGPAQALPRSGAAMDKLKQADAAAQKEKEARGLAGAVFAAKATIRNRRPLLLAGAGVVLLAGAGLYGYLQYVRLSAPSTTFAQPGPAVLVPVPAAAPVATIDASAAAPAPEVAAPASQVAAAVPASPAFAAPAPSMAAPAARTAPRPSPASIAAAPSAPEPARPPRTAAPAALTALAPSRERAAAPIAVTRNDGSRQLNPALASAYQAFVAGDQATARRQYQQALQQEPDNRDALLGLAALAANRAQGAEAGAFYARVLELDPTDAEAASGLASVQRSDPAQAESNLKKVIAASPQTGSAHFALGNVYAQQQRWPEAQQAYFLASGTAPGNADYAFNLAVSLDKLGQKKLALDAYQKSLQLAQRGAAGVNAATVQTRVEQLRRDLAATSP